ncbi:hypothetical protein N0V83_004235 [Neocucurbitaria cava]|uniref:Uncharacterized protein n=1 Tax=Neocucurbitaria cava TaxID=798079 RepID=A0A9W8YAF1_9PLEO|nr:hypothetical protein N0V83_004235 [Neocucurbitaria cava]
MPRSTSASPLKRSRTSDSEASSISEKATVTPSAQDETKASPMPPPASFPTTSPAPVTRSSVLRQKLQAFKRVPSSMSAPDQNQPKVPRAVSVGPENITTAGVAHDVSGPKGGNDMSNQGPYGNTELTLAIIFENMRGTGSGASMISSITAAQASLEQLKSTYQRVSTTPINPADRDHIIKALETLKEGHDPKTASMKGAKQPPKAPQADHKMPVTTTAPRQGILDQPWLKHRVFAQEIHDQKLALRLKAENIEGFIAGVASAQEALTDLKSDIREAYNLGLTEGMAKGKETTMADQEATKEHFEQCKKWLREMAHTRKKGEKARVSALITEAEMAEWLGL